MKLDVLPSSRPWFSRGLWFECTCCGNCCSGPPGYVWMTQDEVRLLATHLGLSYQATIDKYCRRVGDRITLREIRTPQGTFDCVFLKELPPEQQAGTVALPRRVCGIYEVRPLQCRTWPFWEGNLADRESWDRAAKRCPGMNRGRHFTKAEIEARRDAREWPGE